MKRRPLASIRRLLVLLPLALLVAGASAGCGFAPRRTLLPAGAVDLPMPMQGAFPTVDVTLDGTGPHRFIVDTGYSAALLVPPKLARQIGLRPGPIPATVWASNGKPVRGRLATVKRVQVGGATFEGVPVIVLDLGALPVEGLVGMGLFRHCLLTMDFPGERLSLRRGRLGGDGPDTFKVPFDDGRPTVPITLPLAPDGRQSKPVYVVVDTGSNGGLAVPAPLERRLVIDPSIRLETHSDTLAGPGTHEEVRLRGTLRLGRYGVKDVFVGLVRGRGVIGMAALRQFQLTVDAASRRVRLAFPEKRAQAPGT